MSRLHTSSGKFVGWNNLPKGVVSFYQAIIRKTTGRIPREPWIPFSARKALSEVLSNDWRVWEIGAGFSTLWMAPRVRSLVSIEASREWYEKLSAIIRAEGISNVDLRFEWEASRMSDFSELGASSLDLLFVDGGPRGLCLQRGFEKVKSGGYIYLDNWDTEDFWPGANEFLANQSGKIASRKSFIDYVPAQVGVYEGLLLQKA